MTSAATRRTAYRTCPLCEATCGLELTMEGSEVVRIRGDRDDVFSHGFICPKGSTLKQLEQDPDRIRVPQVRQGDTWREATWDEAFELIARRQGEIVEANGADAVGIYLGNPVAHSLAGGIYARPLLKSLRTRNVYSASTVDQMPKHVSAGLMFGGALTIPVPDLDRTDYLLMLGANPWESNGSLCTAPDFPGRLKAIQDRGGRFVVVDPRRSRTAKEADEHVFIRPGTDAMLLSGIASVLISEGLVSLGDLADRVQGVDEVLELLGAVDVDTMATASGVPAGTIRRLARELAAAPTAAVYGRIGTCTQQFGTLNSWLVDVLNVLTGNLDRPGGAMFPNAAHRRIRSRGAGREYHVGRWASRVRGLPEAQGELPVVALAEEIETPGDGQIRMLVTVGGNPVLSTPDSARLDAALGTLDFMVSVDIYRNETTRHADVILPAPSHLERSHYDLAFYQLSVRNVANWSPPVNPLPPGALDEWEILAKLALIAAGQGPESEPSVVDDLVIGELVRGEVTKSGSPVEGRDAEEILDALEPRTGPERVIDFMIRTGPYGDGFGRDPDGCTLAALEARPHGMDFGPLTPMLDHVIATPSGKVELAPQHITADLPRMVEIAGRPLDGLTLVGRRHLRSNNSWMHNIDVLVKGRPRCTLHVHPDDAGRLGLVDGGHAKVTAHSGTLVTPVEITPDVMPGVVSLPHGWGHDMEGSALAVAAAHAGVNVNVLAPAEQVDPRSGNAVLNGIPVSVTPA